MILGIYKMHANDVHIKIWMYYFGNLVKAIKVETKNILIDDKHFTRFANSKLIKMLSLHYHELIEKIKKLERKKYLTFAD